MGRRIDDSIYNIQYILSCLRAYRDIVNSGCCNECKNNNNCKYAPAPGQLVRYNCPFFVKNDICNSYVCTAKYDEYNSYGGTAKYDEYNRKSNWKSFNAKNQNNKKLY